jgi:phosphatidylglycerophosphate synthase
VLIIHLQTHHTQFPPTLLGKCTTAIQLVTVGVCMLANFQARMALAIFPFVVYSALALTVASGLQYAYKSVKIIASYQEAGNVKKGNQDS